MIKNNMILRKVYYCIVVLSFLIFLGGMLLVGVESLSFLVNNHNVENIIIGVPFSIWAWLIIVGLLFIKKNWIIITLLITLAIPHVISIAILYAYSYSVVDILKWYVMILSFGSIIIV